MPLLGGFKILNLGWAGRSSVYVDVFSTHADKLLQLYVNRKLVGVSAGAGSARLEGQVWDAHLSAAPLSVMAVAESESRTDFGDLLEVEPWNRYFLTWTVPADYDPDTHHFDVLGASTFDAVASTLLFRVPYVGPGTYSEYLPAIRSVPLLAPSSAADRNRWQDWNYKVVPRDNAIPLGNAGTAADITIPALIYPADLVYRANGTRFLATRSASTLSLGYQVPA